MEWTRFFRREQWDRERAEEVAAAPQPAPAADLSSLTAMLSAKWKQGSPAAKSSGPEPVRAGQIRTFRILKLDQAAKKIEVELAG